MPTPTEVTLLALSPRCQSPESVIDEFDCAVDRESESK